MMDATVTLGFLIGSMLFSVMGDTMTAAACWIAAGLFNIAYELRRVSDRRK